MAIRNWPRRFWDKVLIGDGCWIWAAARTKTGYGTVGVGNGKTSQAHRVSWELCVGPIPDGMQVLHKCDNPPCVNPDHLFIGTNDDNMKDRKAKGRYDLRGEKNPLSVLTEDAVRDIRENYRPRKTPLKYFAEKYGVRLSAVHMAFKRKTWAHLGD